MTGSRPLRLVAVLVAAALATPARGALGEREASVSADQTAIGAVRRAATTRGPYRIERLETSAQVVREYVSPSGVVFAISWHGVSRPDLSVLLGSYAAAYRRAVAQARPTPGRRASRLEADGAVVESWGHMRALHGRAYVPALLPQGVTLDEIR